jgi:hypothetical protein
LVIASKFSDNGLPCQFYLTRFSGGLASWGSQSA